MDGCYILLLLFNLVIDKDGGTKGSSANLLHDFIVIHPRLHDPQTVTKQSLVAATPQQARQSLNN